MLDGKVTFQKFQYDLTKIHNAGWQAHHTSDESVRETAKFIKEHY